MGCDGRDGANLPETILIVRSEPRTLHGDKELPPAHGRCQKPFLSKWKWCKPRLPNPLWTRGVWSDFSSFLRPCEAIQRSCVPLGVGEGRGAAREPPGGLGVLCTHQKPSTPLCRGLQDPLRAGGKWPKPTSLWWERVAPSPSYEKVAGGSKIQLDCAPTKGEMGPWHPELARWPEADQEKIRDTSISLCSRILIFFPPFCLERLFSLWGLNYCVLMLS